MLQGLSHMTEHPVFHDTMEHIERERETTQCRFVVELICIRELTRI